VWDEQRLRVKREVACQAPVCVQCLGPVGHSTALDGHAVGPWCVGVAGDSLAWLSQQQPPSVAGTWPQQLVWRPLHRLALLCC
jgi:hypothetical protein